MSRIQTCFQQLAGKKALIPYITAGDPHPQHTLAYMHALVAGGADIIELGVPFSDPMADGPVIQKACERALAAGTRLRDVLAIVHEFRQHNQTTPIVLMGYLNPIEAMGYADFTQAAAQAGVDGVLTVDLPPEEAQAVQPLFTAAGLDMIYLIAPTTSDERICKIAASGQGYLYYVSLKGVTGSAALDVEAVAAKMQTLRQLTSLPIAVGFGIRDATSAAQVAQVADGVIVGSALVNQIADLQSTPEAISDALQTTLAAMRQAMDAR
ncbi:tryptophan synthase, alpha chain [Allopseudospirillum japonicum]|uniref:Tryptophan synthase alpha chain n=1 Tax=Allopseudospirillum japonicum TaxID=64971 RepID=A0A1H6SP94_9GAMM|nr:tryptophan synthase subunit alpha [Allopseudospirillum japonicum]SEI68736.1 tryptophan synthase, alpha chain [Allopseudospirillum japonicum]